MTAVAPPPNFQQINGSGWRGPNGPANGLNAMSADEVSRMLMPRKNAQRSNSSSSLSSLSSATSNSSTLSTSSAQSNGTNGVASTNGDWASRRKTARGLWPASKSEPVAGISAARPQPIASASSGPSAASAISALHTPQNMAHQNPQPQTQQNGVSRPQQPQENAAVLYLTPMNGTFERKTITVPFYPDVLRIGRQTNNKTIPTPLNGYFDSKVLSRQHAEIWADRQGKIWIRDVKSSNGTFVNGQRLSQENKDSDPHELREQDMLELGIDIVSEDQKTVVHHKVAARVEHAGFYGASNVLDLNFGDLDPSASAGLLNSAGLGQGLGQMRRTASQSSLASNGRMSVASAQTNMSNVQQRQQHFWLTPVNMDKIIQKLNAEYKAAKQQAQDLQRTSQYIDSILTTENQPPKKDAAQKSSPIEKSKGTPSLKDSLKARFSDPPAPPPQAPLPEKPDAAVQRTAVSLGAAVSAYTPASLARGDTERPRLGSVNSSPVKSATEKQVDSIASAAEMATLADSLDKARQEMEVQSAKLREVEDLLVQERLRREDAEERAKRLEKEKAPPDMQRLQPPPSPAKSAKSDESTTPIDDEEQEDRETSFKKAEDASSRILQERLDLLLAEFNEVKASAEKWRLEKEQMEKERDEERKERKTLAEMVEQLRAQEAERVEKEKKREAKRGRRRSRSASANHEPPKSVDGTEEKNETEEVKEVKRDVAPDSKPVEANGHPPVHQKRPQGSDQSDTRALTQRGTPMSQATPYLSAMSVVVIGVALMTLINKMQQGESPKS